MDAMTGLATGNRAGKPEKRNQIIQTGEDLVQTMTDFWGNIQFDAAPCLGSPATDAAKTHARDGLKDTWPSGTYCNPPFKDLKEWLDKACREAELGSHDGMHSEILLLCPVRTNRPWWMAARDHATEIAYLKAYRFRSFKNAFPAPLALFYWGDYPEQFRYFFRPFSTGFQHGK